jgi:enamine deaminase RidA (YjgF/YER057c/UK114 family)
LTDIKRIEAGKRMSQAVVHNDTIWLSGQVGQAGTSVTQQTTDIVAKIDRLLAECGSSKSRIVQATVWLADMADFAEMNAVYDAWIDPANPPARAAGESRLATPGYKVEIIVTAVK